MAEDARAKGDDAELMAAYSIVVKRMLSVYPHAHSMRIVVDGPDGKAAIPLPMVPAFDDLEGAIIASLSRLRPGEWMLRKTLAVDVDRDVNNGTFCRTLSEMAKRKTIESNTNRGYRLPQT